MKAGGSRNLHRFDREDWSRAKDVDKLLPTLARDVRLTPRDRTRTTLCLCGNRKSPVSLTCQRCRDAHYDNQKSTTAKARRAGFVLTRESRV